MSTRGGKMTDWGAHHNDIAQWGLGMDDSGPVFVTATGTTPSKKPNCYNCHPHFAVTYIYPNGIRLITTSDGENGNRFIGDRGWIFVNRERIEASDPKLLEEPLPPDAHRLYMSNDHMGNFMDCIKSRKRCICDVEVGLHSVTGLPHRRDRPAAGHSPQLGSRPPGVSSAPGPTRAMPCFHARCGRRGGLKSEKCVAARSFADAVADHASSVEAPLVWASTVFRGSMSAHRAIPIRATPTKMKMPGSHRARPV